MTNFFNIRPLTEPKIQLKALTKATSFAIAFALVFAFQNETKAELSNPSTAQFASIEKDFSMRLASSEGLEYVDRNSQKTKLKLKSGKLTEFQCQTVEKFLINEGIMKSDEASLSSADQKTAIERRTQIYKSLPLSLLRIINQKSQGKDRMKGPVLYRRGGAIIR